MKHIFCILTLVVLVLSCMSGPDFTTDVSKELYFSTDTLKFDTLFSTVPSATKWIKIFNPHKEYIRIAQIGLVSDSSIYRLNVDGENGQSFSDIEIWGKDSLYIAVEVRPVENGKRMPVKTEDQLYIDVNGKRKSITLSAHVWDAVLLKGYVIDTDTAFDAQKPVVVYDSLRINKSAILHVGAGTRFFMHHNAKMIVEGSLNCEGTAENPVVFRGDRFDRMNGSIAYDHLSGQWGGLYFRNHHGSSALTHVQIRNASVGIQVDSLSASESRLTIHNSIIHNSSLSALDIQSGYLEGRGCLFSNSGSALVNLRNGQADFEYCTFVNYYPFGSKGVCLYVNNKDISLRLSHTIVWGSKKDELIFKHSQYPHSLEFNYCLLKGSAPSPDAVFSNVLWNVDPLFLRIDPGNYIFDYRIGTNKDLEGFGENRIIPDLSFDYFGAKRDFEKPMIGAFAQTKD